MTVVQPFPRPETFDEFLAVKDQLVDLTGKPLVSIQCAACGHRHYAGEPCSTDVKCPDCGSTSQSCKRPSEHESREWHKDRWEEYERVVARLIAAGETRMAAPWPARPSKADPLTLF